MPFDCEASRRLAETPLRSNVRGNSAEVVAGVDMLKEKTLDHLPAILKRMLNTEGRKEETLFTMRTPKQIF